MTTDKQQDCIDNRFTHWVNPSLVTKESNSIQNGENIYREGAKYAKDVKNKRDFALQQGLQDFLSDLRAFAVPSSSSGLSGLGFRC
jgi:hypothetical protein